jgi:hypothetical protein
VTQLKLSNNVPKLIVPKYPMNSNGEGIISYVSQPDLTALGHPSYQPNFSDPIVPVTIYTGLTTLSNYTQNIFTTIISKTIFRRKNPQ